LADALYEGLNVSEELLNLLGIQSDEGHVVILLPFVERTVQRPGILLRQLAGTDELLVEKGRLPPSVWSIEAAWSTAPRRLRRNMRSTAGWPLPDTGRRSGVAPHRAALRAPVPSGIPAAI
jgi:hypothetical protein